MFMDNTFKEFPIPTYEEWRQLVERTLKGKTFDESLLTPLIDEIVLEPMYQSKDIENNQTLNDRPGTYPFIRGNTQEPLKWSVSQVIEAATPKLLHERISHDFEKGQDHTHFVLTSEMKQGRKPTRNEEETGIPFFNLSTVHEALNGIDLSNKPLHLDTGVVSLPILGALSLTSKKLKGTIGSDPLHQLVSFGSIDYSLDRSFDLMALATKWARKQHPQLRTVLVQSHIYHNGGASPSLELASALSTAVEYISALIERGLSATEAGQSLLFSFSIGSDYFSEIAKIRAARALWAAIMKEFGASEEGQKMTIHAKTSTFTKTKDDCHVNILRCTTEAFAAAIAGVESLQVSPFDELLQEPSEHARRIARNTSLILREEAHLAVTSDPAGGSWYVEHLTEQMAMKAWELFQELEENGGMSASLKKGIVQTLVQKCWNKRVEKVRTRKQTIIGVNQYINTDDKRPTKPASRVEERNSYFDYIEQQKEVTKKHEIETMEDVLKMVSEQTPFHHIHKQLKEGGKKECVTPIKQYRLAEPFEQQHPKKDGGS
ncbi:methylmalonyl-CoA mutase [Halalkalibacter wakoensis JCM 9140]|uniref:Methylmalonyl-CoA mutase n=1 Tax=Halalkalibacter wakoensis JCM 9140 TaxID=1236970 RepID=W4Q307_9BACI|nr:methylmalonyl-CoA mutase subunit beta [Halalkalibacter wakoensis]GAE26340.1 methylmalonyl-CoA mutase [Halalkalibacter wakoensis JCM 9140]